MTTLTQDGLDPKEIDLEVIASELLLALREDRNPVLPEGWKYWVAINSLSAHYRDGSAAKSAFYVPVVRADIGSEKVDVGGFVRHPEGCCGYCGSYMGRAWECPSCGAS